ncbi:MAG TPA: DUF4268 domain-containing protein [Pyrinomonadaceae bacterium]|nr:DUF4268 domain-containing protein [Pyrinomonadaceae bacterium]
MALAPNTILQNRYRVVRKLGEGGMGSVYLAIDERFDSEVAIKESHYSDEASRKQFEREARLLNKLRHPAMTRVIDHFTEGDGQFLVMDYVEGEDLWEMLKKRKGAFPPNRVLEWADQLLDALCYLHKQEPPIVHRDIKPQNLKLSGSGQIILLDFGLAKGTLGQSTSIMTSRSVFGYTPVYAPLEQIHGSGTDPKSDLYSLGATLYHLITGIMPTDAPTRFNALEEGRDDPLQPAHEMKPEVPREISEILERAMAVSRRERTASATEMRAALKGVNRDRAEAIELKDTVLPPTIIIPSPASPANKEDNLTDTQRLQLEYWTAFRDFLLRSNSSLKTQKPQPQQWYPFSVGRTNFMSAATIQRKGRRISVNITLAGPEAKPHFHLLHQDKEVIEREIGEHLEWRELSSGKESHIRLTRYKTDPENRQDWEAQHKWLKEKLELFHRVFAPRIKSLNASNYVAESEIEDRSEIVSTAAAATLISPKIESSESQKPPAFDAEKHDGHSLPKSKRTSRTIMAVIALLVIGVSVFLIANRSASVNSNSTGARPGANSNEAENLLFGKHFSREHFDRNRGGYAQASKDFGASVGNGSDDLYLWAAINNKLLEEKEALSYSTIDVDVSYGNVTLRGKVLNETQKTIAGNLAYTIDGVKSVKNNITW